MNLKQHSLKMVPIRNAIKSCFIVLISLTLLVAGFSCKKNSADKPTSTVIIDVTGAYATSSTSIQVSGAVTGGVSITDQGVYWTTELDETKHTISVTGNPALGFTGTIPNLTPNTPYHVGVYGTN